MPAQTPRRVLGSMAPAYTPREGLAMQLSTPREHVPGYTGFTPRMGGMFGLTFGKSTELALEAHRTPREGPATTCGLNIEYKIDNKVREIPQLVGLPGPGFTAMVDKATPRILQGTTVDLATYYRILTHEREKVKEFCHATGKPITMKNRVRNTSNIEFGDKYYWAGNHMFETTNRESFKDEHRADFNHSASVDPGTVETRRRIYEHARATVGPNRIRALEEQLRMKLMQKTATGGKELHRAFKQFDRDGSGHIDSNEFAQVMHWFGVSASPQDSIALFGTYDTGADGSINYHEFLERVVPP